MGMITLCTKEPPPPPALLLLLQLLTIVLMPFRSSRRTLVSRTQMYTSLSLRRAFSFCRRRAFFEVGAGAGGALLPEVEGTGRPAGAGEP